MGEQLVTELERIIDELATSTKPQRTQFTKISEEVAKAFGVKADEVAVLGLDDEAKVLSFLIPEKLKSVGTIPLTSTSSLAARTARENRPEIINRFNTSRHAIVFEGVPLEGRQGEQIQKIMSAPIVDEAKVIGVVQISRKGLTSTGSGPEFSQKDLQQLIALSNVLGRFVKACKVS